MITDRKESWALVLSKALERVQSGQIEQALELLPSVAATARRHEIGCRSVIQILMAANRYREALRWCDAALRLTANLAPVHALRGQALQSLGRLGPAIEAYTAALTTKWFDPETHYNLGTAQQAAGNIDHALAAYDQAIALRPDYFKALLARASGLALRGRPTDALSSVDAALRIDLASAEAHCLRGDILHKLGRYAEALADYDIALGETADMSTALVARATVLKDLDRCDDALRDMDKALAIGPQNADALVLKANILMDLGRTPDAETAYRIATALRPVVTLPARTNPPAFRALLLFAPFGGNTPCDDLVSLADFESNVLFLLPGQHYDAKRLRRYGNVVVNLVSDCDRGASALDQAACVLDDLHLPVLNRPALIRKTSRDQMSRMLAGTPGCIVPEARLATRQALSEDLSLIFPAVVRAAGTHGGERMERIDDAAALSAFIAAGDERTFYAVPFIDYRSPDGLYRKYRFMFVGEQILPYHLAIGSHWKVHHASTDMTQHPWMQDEEARFLRDPWSVFSPRSATALDDIRRRVGLDYFGIDCALDAAANVIVFEVNATMLVHLRNEQFPYKEPAVARIKAAFRELLAGAALRRR